MCRQGIADYIITMRKPGDNPDPVTHTNDSFPVDKWQQYASPVWMDIKLMLLTLKILFKAESTEGVDSKQITAMKTDSEEDNN